MYEEEEMLEMPQGEEDQEDAKDPLIAVHMSQEEAAELDEAQGQEVIDPKTGYKIYSPLAAYMETPGIGEEMKKAFLTAKQVVKENPGMKQMNKMPATYAQGGMVMPEDLGRKGDDSIVLMPLSLAKFFDDVQGKRSINPETGLREYGFFTEFLRVAAPIAGTIVGSMMGMPHLGIAAMAGLSSMGVNAATGQPWKYAMKNGLTNATLAYAAPTAAQSFASTFPNASAAIGKGASAVLPNSASTALGSYLGTGAGSTIGGMAAAGAGRALTGAPQPGAQPTTYNANNSMTNLQPAGQAAGQAMQGAAESPGIMSQLGGLLSNPWVMTPAIGGLLAMGQRDDNKQNKKASEKAYERIAQMRRGFEHSPDISQAGYHSAQELIPVDEGFDPYDNSYEHRHFPQPSQRRYAIGGEITMPDDDMGMYEDYSDVGGMGFAHGGQVQYFGTGGTPAKKTLKDWEKEQSALTGLDAYIKAGKELGRNANKFSGRKDLDSEPRPQDIARYQASIYEPAALQAMARKFYQSSQDPFWQTQEANGTDESGIKGMSQHYNMANAYQEAYERSSPPAPAAPASKPVVPSAASSPPKPVAIAKSVPTPAAKVTAPVLPPPAAKVTTPPLAIQPAPTVTNKDFEEKGFFARPVHNGRDWSQVSKPSLSKIFDTPELLTPDERKLVFLAGFGNGHQRRNSNSPYRRPDNEKDFWAGKVSYPQSQQMLNIAERSNPIVGGLDWESKLRNPPKPQAAPVSTLPPIAPPPAPKPVVAAPPPALPPIVPPAPPKPMSAPLPSNPPVMSPAPPVPPAEQISNSHRVAGAEMMNPDYARQIQAPGSYFQGKDLYAQNNPPPAQSIGYDHNGPILPNLPKGARAPSFQEMYPSYFLSNLYSDLYGQAPQRRAMGGPITGPGGGQDDLIRSDVPENAYIVDATTVSRLGDGSTQQGFRNLDMLKQHADAYPVFPQNNMPQYSHGGMNAQNSIPAMLSDGEYQLDPQTVANIGNGSNKQGVKILDQFRKNIRADGAKNGSGMPSKMKPYFHYLPKSNFKMQFEQRR